MKAFFSKLGQTFMLPIALLPAAGIMLGVGASFTNQSMIEAYNLGSVLAKFSADGAIQSSTFLYKFLQVMSAAGGIVFDNLPLMFAIAIAIGFAKKEKGAAALAAVMGYLVMTVSAAQLLNVLNLVSTNSDGTLVLSLFGLQFQGLIKENMLGVSNALEMGVFGGIISGGITVLLHNRFIDQKVPQFLGFFGGPRLVPILASFTALFYGMGFVFIWPFIGGALASIGSGLGALIAGGFGFVASLIFGLIERSLIPLGLHHVFYLPLWQTSVGGTAVIGGETIAGTQNIFFEVLKTGEWDKLTATNFMTGKFPFMMFGLPAAAYAMYSCADKENKKEVAGLYFSIGLTSFLTGITEPIEFTFLFLAPALYYGIHVPLAGISFMLMDLLSVKVGQTFSGGFIDFTLFGVIPGIGGADNNWYFIPAVGIVYAIIYFVAFRWYITKFDIATPGRNGAIAKTVSKEEYRNAKKESNESTTSVSGATNDFTDQLIEALGGADNISDVDACITRLRVSVKNADLVKDNDYWVSNLGATGLMKNGNAIQAIYGAKAAGYKTDINSRLGK